MRFLINLLIYGVALFFEWSSKKLLNIKLINGLYRLCRSAYLACLRQKNIVKQWDLHMILVYTLPLILVNTFFNKGALVQCGWWHYYDVSWTHRAYNTFWNSSHLGAPGGNLLGDSTVKIMKHVNIGEHYIELRLDGLSALFILMTVLVVVLLHFSARPLHNRHQARMWSLALVLVEYSLVGVFIAHDLYSFFFFFELTLIPMFSIILLFGVGTNTRRASYWLLFFTLASSVFLALATFIVKRAVGSVSFSNLTLTFSDQVLGQTPLAFFCCLFFLVAFAIKLPLFPLHIWLPEVHVEASTTGSMLLASLLLKLGGYGIVRICYMGFPYIFVQIAPILKVLLLVSIFISATVALVQLDLKKIIAYSSVAHMAVSFLGLVHFTELGLTGCILGWFAHAFTSPALFYLVGSLYSRFRTRNILYMSGLNQTMPVFTFLFLLFVLSNMSFPGTLNFIAEFYTLVGFVSTTNKLNALSVFLLVINLVLVSAYNLIMFVRVAYGPLVVLNTSPLPDLSLQEVFTLLLWALPIIFYAFYPHSLVGLAMDLTTNLAMM